MKFYCHTSLYLNDDPQREVAVKGKTYKVLDETEFDYTIVNEENSQHSFSKEPDEEGQSYSSWFNLL